MQTGRDHIDQFRPRLRRQRLTCVKVQQNDPSGGARRACGPPPSRSAPRRRRLPESLPDVAKKQAPRGRCAAFVPRDGGLNGDDEYGIAEPHSDTDHERTRCRPYNAPVRSEHHEQAAASDQRKRAQDRSEPIIRSHHQAAANDAGECPSHRHRAQNQACGGRGALRLRPGHSRAKRRRRPSSRPRPSRHLGRRSGSPDHAAVLAPASAPPCRRFSCRTSAASAANSHSHRGQFGMRRQIRSCWPGPGLGSARRDHHRGPRPIDVGAVATLLHVSAEDSDHGDGHDTDRQIDPEYGPARQYARQATHRGEGAASCGGTPKAGWKWALHTGAVLRGVDIAADRHGDGARRRRQCLKAPKDRQPLHGRSKTGEFRARARNRPRHRSNALCVHKSRRGARRSGC